MQSSILQLPYDFMNSRSNSSILKKSPLDFFALHLLADGSQDAAKLAPDVQQATQEIAPKSSEELVEVHRRGRQHGVDRIARNALEPVVLQPVFQL